MGPPVRGPVRGVPPLAAAPRRALMPSAGRA
ncbi:hypothetical protein SAMN05216267_105316 [Actinacidiphila rubida]|uniref:Uncharacterized protein n=1 Tax=Actinacidiphila rubida TaxID=310780 RepID=A0A1H8TGF8_9ACTN|nr:hypothetical protein SAMN05216267_105316 [Actinacidiphila rubida]